MRPHDPEADLRGDPGEQLILGGEVTLHVRHLVQGRARIVEGRLRALVSGVSLYVLSDHDDRQQHQLQEGLCHPGNERRRPPRIAAGRLIRSNTANA
jgi:hypothetical protein